MDIKKVCSSLRVASGKLALQNACQKNAALEAVAVAMDKNRASIIAANNDDVAAARAAGISESIIDRLLVDAPEAHDERVCTSLLEAALHAEDAVLA